MKKKEKEGEEAFSTPPPFGMTSLGSLVILHKAAAGTVVLTEPIDVSPLLLVLLPPRLMMLPLSPVPSAAANC